MDAQFRSRDAVFVDDLPVEALKSRDRALGKLPISHLVEHVHKSCRKVKFRGEYGENAYSGLSDGTLESS